MRGYEARIKRIFDLVGAGLGLILLSPVMAITALAVKATSSGPAFYQQSRIGARNTPFTLLKFRSMPVDSPVLSSAESDTLQTTAVGRVIRRTNVDELPQLINIIRGEMSLVGPRPALPTQHDLLNYRTSSGAARLRPGLTGLAQVNSFDGMEPDDKAGWDEAYARSVTLASDLRIIASTFRYLSKPPPKY